jgi:hypothetical protein
MPPFVNDSINDAQAKRVFFNVMVMNPSVEVYLLNPGGKILSYYAPDKKIIREKVSLTPILAFIKTQGLAFILGDDPKSSSAKKIFSAAKVEKNNKLLGYIYIVLAVKSMILLPGFYCKAIFQTRNQNHAYYPGGCLHHRALSLSASLCKTWMKLCKRERVSGRKPASQD